MMSPL